MPEHTDDTLILFGGPIKAERIEDGVKLGGYLVRFGGEDVTGEFFDADTDYDIDLPSKKTTYFNHGIDPKVGKRKLGKAELKGDDFGIWAETILHERDEYEKFIAELGLAGKLGWSSGTAAHLMDRQRMDDGRTKITRWPIVEASLTHTPAEPRNTLVPIKSLFDTPQPEQGDPEPDTTEDTTMTEEVKAQVQEQPPAPDFEALIKSAVDEAVKALRDAEPKPKPKVETVEDEADRALKGNPFRKGEFLKAIYRAEVFGDYDKRLLPLKATGANEAIPSEGGFLVTPDISEVINQNVWGVGKVLSRFPATRVSGNGLTLKAVDETSRADGSRMGGVRGYWLAEAAQATSSQPKFRTIDLKLKKLAALVYATDELLEDESAMESWIVNNVPAELRFLAEDAIIDGNGIGKPVGIIQSNCLVSATRTDANEVDADDIGRMWAARYTGVDDYVWFINQAVLPQLYRMTIADGGYTGVYMPPGGLSAVPYGTLLGRPVIETEYNPYLGTLGDILLVSPSQYALITKGGVQSASSIHIKFDYMETAFRFIMRMDGQPIWASAVTAYDATASISPFVALAATT